MEKRQFRKIDTMKAGKRKARAESTEPGIVKVPSGIKGFDEITGGGLPKGRPALVSGGPGCGKTLFAMEFVARGIEMYGEPGVFVSFEEKIGDLEKNFASLGFDLDRMVRQQNLVLDHIHLDRSEIEEAGTYDLEGLFIRLGALIDKVGAERVAIDTLEALFSGFSNEAILRSELSRLFLWLKDRGMTTVVTGERGDRTITKYGLEEYVADCVITLDHRVTNQIATRRLRIVKYRGSTHGTNEYPFLISSDGISVLPITSLALTHKAGSEKVPTGIPRLDAMLGGEGYYQGSSVLVSGQAGTGKTSIAAKFAEATCARGKRCLFFTFEESESQIIRNMNSIGIPLDTYVAGGSLRFHAVRPTAFSLEMHLSMMLKLIQEFNPEVVIVDPVSNLFPVGDDIQVRSMLMRLIDYIKTNQITGLFTNLSAITSQEAYSIEPTQSHVSSLMDAWISLKNVEGNGERNRVLSIVKARGLPHSNQLREFVLSDAGIDILDVYTGSGAVLFGSARVAQANMDRVEQLLRDRELSQKIRELEQKREEMEREIEAIRERFSAEEEELESFINEQRLREKETLADNKGIETIRGVEE